MVMPISGAPNSSLATSDVAHRYYKRVDGAFVRCALGMYVAHPAYTCVAAEEGAARDKNRR